VADVYFAASKFGLLSEKYVWMSLFSPSNDDGSLINTSTCYYPNFIDFLNLIITAYGENVHIELMGLFVPDMFSNINNIFTGFGGTYFSLQYELFTNLTFIDPERLAIHCSIYNQFF
jgi:hypothetical protein